MTQMKMPPGKPGRFRTIFVIRGISAEGMDLVNGVLDIQRRSVKYISHPGGVQAQPCSTLATQMAGILSNRVKVENPELLAEAKGFRGPFSKGIVSMTIRRGEIKFLLGPNGAGKTTFGRQLVSQRRNSEQLCVSAGAVATMALQNPERSLFAHSVKKQLRDDSSLLELCGLTIDDQPRQPLSLSRSKQKLLSIASALQIANDIAILDEASLGLDECDYFALARLITAYPQLAIVMITHDPILIELADQMKYELIDLELA